MRIRKNLAYYSNLIYLKGLIIDYGGNISYKIRDNLFLISPINNSFGRINYKDFVKINSDLQILDRNVR